jgi:hypothetical protein
MQEGTNMQRTVIGAIKSNSGLVPQPISGINQGVGYSEAHKGAVLT